MYAVCRTFVRHSVEPHGFASVYEEVGEIVLAPILDIEEPCNNVLAQVLFLSKFEVRIITLRAPAEAS